MEVLYNQNVEKWYRNHYGWLLFLIINMSGNLCFEILLPYKAIIIILFIFLLFKCINSKRLRSNHVFLLYIWFLILIIPGTYLTIFSFPATLHVFIKIAIGIFIIAYCKDYFCKYYVDIMFFFSIISLIAFTYNCMGGIIPYIYVENSSLDEGNIFRVSSILYTQLYQLQSGSLTLRNCGPFWEPGAYQGFLNLAIVINLLYNKRDKQWKYKNIVFIITIITTFSTGGYITLFFVLIYIIYANKITPSYIKVLYSLIILFTACYLYFSIDFLGDKIANDNARIAVSLNDFPKGLMLLFGYGYDPTAFNTSSIKTAAALILLIRYSGIIGFILYFTPMLRRLNSVKNLMFLIIVLLLLMNEPFLTTGPFWWGVPFFLESFKPVKNV